MGTALKMKGITKRFGQETANDEVNLEVRWGEVHALLGENGAGKTTLMNILYGLYQADAGEILLDGAQVEIRSVQDAIKNKIGMIHQHFMLIDSFSVAENVVLGTGLTDRVWFNRTVALSQVSQLIKQYGFELDSTLEVSSLSVGQRQKVEIIKALYRDARLLILDEPTAVLTPQEAEILFKVLERFKEEGKAVIFISHKLNEVMRISDRITVLRKGRVVGTVAKKSVTPATLAEMMVGKEVLFKLPERSNLEGKRGLQIKGLEVKGNDGIVKLRGFNLELCYGEILGLAGIEGNGQVELVEALRGLCSVEKGNILFEDLDLTNKSPKKINEAGICHIPEDRLSRGLIREFSVQNNLILGLQQQAPFSRKFLVNWKVVADHALKMVEGYDIRPRSITIKAKYLSGGNQQKLVIAREFSKEPKLIIAVQPTRGLDIAATEFVHQELINMRNQGKMVLLISSDLDEILALSDRVAVIYEGRCVGVKEARKASPEEIGAVMAGNFGGYGETAVELQVEGTAGISGRLRGGGLSEGS